MEAEITPLLEQMIHLLGLLQLLAVLFIPIAVIALLCAFGTYRKTD